MRAETLKKLHYSAIILKINYKESQNLYESIEEYFPYLTGLGNEIIQKIKQEVSDKKYALPKTITMNWLKSHEFEANANINPDHNAHNIDISYGVPISIMDHSSKFIYICENIYSGEKYDLTFSNFKYGNEEKRHVLPIDLSTEYLNTSTLKYSLSWLYLHEQAHHFQSHGSVFSQLSDNKKTNFNIEWNENSIKERDEYESLSQRDASIKHAFELSADYEATYLIIKFLQKGRIIKCSDLWILITGLTYLFHKFYGEKRECHKGLVKGTHPNPTIRMRLIYLQLLATFREPKMKKNLEENKIIDDYEKTMEHAFFTAMLYCHQKSTEDPDSSEFMNKIFDYESAANKKYMHSIKEIWDEIRPNVLKEYFGYSIESILPQLKNPLHK